MKKLLGTLLLGAPLILFSYSVGVLAQQVTEGKAANPPVNTQADGSVSENDPVGDLLARAQQGDRRAQYRLGLFYESMGNNEQAIEWMKTAGNNGDVLASSVMASWYRFGLVGLQKNSGSAFEWSLKAANGGNLIDILFVGTSYLKGEGVGKDEVEGAKWLIIFVETKVLPPSGNSSTGRVFLIENGILPTADEATYSMLTGLQNMVRANLLPTISSEVMAAGRKRAF